MDKASAAAGKAITLFALLLAIVAGAVAPAWAVDRSTDFPPAVAMLDSEPSRAEKAFDRFEPSGSRHDKSSDGSPDDPAAVPLASMARAVVISDKAPSVSPAASPSRDASSGYLARAPPAA